jgi:hypothetical protein
MSNDTKLPDFDEFTRWLAARSKAPAANRERYETVAAAARSARDEFLQARRAVASVSEPPPRHGHFEVLQLLAAADKSADSRVPEVMTARGFRVTLAFDEGEDAVSSSIAVLVRCPAEMIETLEGETVYLWNGAQRFELGQFDAEGKALGTLPAGIEISLSDFAMGHVKLEEPPPAAED